MSLAIQLPRREDQTAFKRAAWERITADPALAGIEVRLESDRHGPEGVVHFHGPDRRRGSSAIGLAFPRNVQV